VGAVDPVGHLVANRDGRAAEDGLERGRLVEDGLVQAAAQVSLRLCHDTGLRTSVCEAHTCGVKRRCCCLRRAARGSGSVRPSPV
jgi:hypothetical protein